MVGGVGGGGDEKVVLSEKYQFSTILHARDGKVQPKHVNNVLNIFINSKLQAVLLCFALPCLLCCSAVCFFFALGFNISQFNTVYVQVWARRHSQHSFVPRTPGQIQTM